MSLHARFFSKRAKTDLGSDTLAAYKSSKRLPGSIKYPAPKVPMFNRPVPQQRQQQKSAFVRQQQALPAAEQTTPDRVNLPSVQTPPSAQVLKKTEKIKPVIKDKPQFTTFKQQQQEAEALAAAAAAGEAKKLKEVSIKRQLENEAALEKTTLFCKVASNTDLTKAVEDVSEEVEPTSITVNTNSACSSLRREQELEEAAAGPSTAIIAASDGGGGNKLVIDTGLDRRGSRLDSVENQETTFTPKSEPLLIITQPLNDKSESSTISATVEASGDSSAVDAMSESPDKSCSTSFESTTEDSILESCPNPPPPPPPMAAEVGVSGNPDMCDLSAYGICGGGANSSLRTKSPSSASTTSRCPPSPVPMGLRPTRLAVVPDWDEYEDVLTGRKFYCNATTKEKSWKPPRKPRCGGIEGKQA